MVNKRKLYNHLLGVLKRGKYEMWATFDMDDAQGQIAIAISRRVAEHPIASAVEVLRFPVGILFIRGDRGGEAAGLAEQVVKSYGYWNDDAGKYLDIAIPGWGKDGDSVVFDRKAFLHCRKQMEAICQWRYSGETDLLLLNYESKMLGDGHFSTAASSFESCIWLPVEEMIRTKRVANLDQLMHELIVHAKACWSDQDQGGVWQISDRVAFYRGQKQIWEKLKGWLDVAGLYKELRPFVICDLRLP